MSRRSPADLRKHKAGLQARYGERPWFRGVGIAPSADDGELVLRLNVDDRELGDDELPTECDGCPIEIVHIAGYEKR